MISQSAAFNAAFLSDSRQILVSIDINGAIFTNDGVNNMTYSNSVLNGESLDLGSTTVAQISLELAGVIKTIAIGHKLVPKIGIVLPDGSTEFTSLGVFYINDVKRDLNTQITKITAYDLMAGLGGQYVSKLTYPATIRAVAQEIASLAGMIVDATIAALPTDKINKLPDNYTYRQAIGTIAQFVGGYATFTRDGKLAVRKLDTTNAVSINPDNFTYSGFDRSETSYVIAGLQATISSDEDETTLQSGSATGNQVVLDNPVMTQALLDKSYNVVKGYSFYPYTLDWRGLPNLEVGDIIELTDVDGVVYNIPNLSYTLEFDGGLGATSTADFTSVGDSDVDFGTGLTQAIKQSITAAQVAKQQAADALAASDKLNTDLSKQINDNKNAADESIANAQSQLDKVTPLFKDTSGNYYKDLNTALLSTKLLGDANGNQSIIAQTKSSWTADIQSAKTGLQSQITAGDDSILASVGSYMGAPNLSVDSDLAGQVAYSNLWTIQDAWYVSGATPTGKGTISWGVNTLNSERSSNTYVYGPSFKVGRNRVYSASIQTLFRTTNNASDILIAGLQFSGDKGATWSNVVRVSNETGTSGTHGFKLFTLENQTLPDLGTDYALARWAYVVKGGVNAYIAEPQFNMGATVNPYQAGPATSFDTVMGLFDGRFALGIQNNQGLITSGVFGDVNGMTITGKTVTIDANTTIIKNLNASNVMTGTLSGVDIKSTGSLSAIATVATGSYGWSFASNWFNGGSDGSTVSITGTLKSNPTDGLVVDGTATRTPTSGSASSKPYRTQIGAGVIVIGQTSATTATGLPNGVLSISAGGIQYNQGGGDFMRINVDGYSSNTNIIGGYVGQTNDVDWTPLGTVTAFGPYGGGSANVLKFKKYLNRVEISGVITPTANYAGTSDLRTISGLLPANARPLQTKYFLQQATGTATWLLTIGTDGTLSFSRHRSGNSTSYATVSAGDWLPITASFTI